MQSERTNTPTKPEFEGDGTDDTGKIILRYMDMSSL